MKKKYFSKMPIESLKGAEAWGIRLSKKNAIKEGFDGLKNGYGKSFKIVRIEYIIEPLVYKPKRTK